MEKTYLLPNEFTFTEVSRFKSDMYDLITSDSIELTVDFSDCIFIDSTGLGAIVSIFKRLNENEGSLTLIHMNENVRDLFAMTRLDQVISIV